MKFLNLIDENSTYNLSVCSDDSDHYFVSILGGFDIDGVPSQQTLLDENQVCDLINFLLASLGCSDKYELSIIAKRKSL